MVKSGCRFPLTVFSAPSRQRAAGSNRSRSRIGDATAARTFIRLPGIGPVMTPRPRQNRGSMPPIESLDWDSAFFGVQIGRVSLGSAAPEQLSEAVGWADQRKIECLYWLIDGEDAISPRAAEAYGFH